MWIMLWLFMSTTGGLTSGSAEFPTKEACEAGRKELGGMLVRVNEGGDGTARPMFAPPPEIRCIQKATGKP
ncbi:hypothetical protein [Methylobacterium sp. 10]|uniref:hypothetical protein n=1 Tax=Methylobacterium sp. 10 TaxID=1101191 RepID=UPI0004BA88FA|nr:hypothetical protein [Methylobacterium sp. 10]